MLMQNFKSADELEITEPEKEALIKTLVLLETGELRHVADPDDLPKAWTPFRERKFTGDFNMIDWNYAHTCGTCCCIGGTAELVGGLEVHGSFNGADEDGTKLHELFYPEPSSIPGRSYRGITPAQAATALRSYLTTGDARWDLAVS
jgi:hypothetical protein